MSNQMTKDNIDLTSVGPGTTMGQLMRQYWLPALQSSELVAGGSPVRLLLLGEKLVAFRSPDGTTGVMDHRCAHRNASLFFGRNEEGGLRCIYHGWQFDTSGDCVDVPNIPNGESFRQRVHTTAYKSFEKHGIVWVFMGDQERVPEPPCIEVMDAEEGELELEFAQRECNYLQALEGDIDTSHLGFLHVGNVEPHHLKETDPMKYVVANRAPELEVADAPWGTTYCAFKPADGGGRYLRYANFMFPFWTQAPQGEFETNLFSRAWVPMDDTHTMSVTLTWKKRPPTFKPMKDGNELPGVAPLELHPNTTEWLGRYRTVQSLANDYLMDREAQRTNRLFSGIENIGVQDQAVTESMGEITDRTREHLSPSDTMIARTRRRILRAARGLENNGVLPPGVNDPFVYRLARSGEMVVPTHEAWEETYKTKLEEAVRIGA
jgi:phenylpropionate dioxygenase-like ring-hydroxylating dioxygenase large terminal subunit